jgi:hypothetical protein
MSTLLVFEQEPAQTSRNVLQMVVCRLYAYQSVYVSRLVCDFGLCFMRALPERHYLHTTDPSSVVTGVTEHAAYTLNWDHAFRCCTATGGAMPVV